MTSDAGDAEHPMNGTDARFTIMCLKKALTALKRSRPRPGLRGFDTAMCREGGGDTSSGMIVSNCLARRLRRVLSRSSILNNGGE
ncbi:MAG: hypothetical protein M9932_06825 [Xanthobacteraceae bacterium]|nr:hypothetical protein [Xanthobacteraceae bacterium]